VKRIILGLSTLLMLAQNGFAETDAEWDKMIDNATMQINKLIFSCNKEVENYQLTGNPEVCVKAFNALQKEYPNEKDNTKSVANNAGALYIDSKKNYIKAYEYYMKAAKLGNTVAQSNLDILCREHSWVCK
jgi:TPR repeat protein